MNEFTVNYSNNKIDYLLDKLNQPNKRIYERLSEQLSEIERKINNKEEFERIISIIEEYVSKKLHEIENDSKNSFTFNLEKDIRGIVDIKNNDIIGHIGHFIVLIFIYNMYEAHANSPRYPYFTIIK